MLEEKEKNVGVVNIKYLTIILTNFPSSISSHFIVRAD